MSRKIRILYRGKGKVLPLKSTAMKLNKEKHGKPPVNATSHTDSGFGHVTCFDIRVKQIY